MAGFTKHKIAEGIFQITNPMDGCVTLIIGSEKALLWDTNFGILDLKAFVESLTDLPLIVVDSHGHVDHMNGNYQFPEVYLHPLDFELALRHSNPEWKTRVLTGQKRMAC